MKKILIPLFFVGLSVSAFAENLFEQLVTFNPNWQSYEKRIYEQGAKHFASDNEYIQTHLTHVLSILGNNSTDALDCEQLAMRVQLIDILEDYKNRGLFPMNYYRMDRIPVFIDEHNTHCAVGFLLKETGYDFVAKSIASKNNYAWVKEIENPMLPTWQTFSGFTMEELKLIQGAYDSYMPFARVAPNKTEIPQAPDVVVLDFSGNEVEAPGKDNVLSVWCYGEGVDSTLHGRWIQNYRNGTPWIEGYFENGNRTGSWKEYYQGTTILCRTEHWRDDKLNGVRTRYDREGNIIERITFKDGEALQKINYDLQGDFQYIRKPIDSMTLETEVYSITGYLLAKGKERISNPTGKLQWFQDIELTALNTFAITARDDAPEYTQGGVPIYANNLSNPPLFDLSELHYAQPRGYAPTFLNQGPTLVNYLKIGEWKYYNEFSASSYVLDVTTAEEYLKKDYPHFGTELAIQFSNADLESMHGSFDSIQTSYKFGRMTNFHGYAQESSLQLKFIFENNAMIDQIDFPIYPQVRGIGEVQSNGSRIGNWVLFDQQGRPAQYIKYVQPFKEEEPLSGSL